MIVKFLLLVNPKTQPRIMKKQLLKLFITTSILCAGSISDAYKEDAQKIIETCLNNEKGFERLAELCDTFGPRFTGSQNLEDAIDWILEKMENDGLSNVHGEKVKVPRWIRGNESLELIEPFAKDMHILGLGGSVGTPKKGIRGEVFAVNSFDDLEANFVVIHPDLESLESLINGKVLLFLILDSPRPMN